MSRVTCRHRLRNKRLTSHFKCRMVHRISNHQSLKVQIKVTILLMSMVMSLIMIKRVLISQKDSRVAMERWTFLKYKMQCRRHLRNKL